MADDYDMRRFEEQAAEEEDRPWSGILLFINEVSRKSPGGAMGRKVKWNRDAADDIVRDVCGKWVGLGHSGDLGFQKVGIVQTARIVDNAIVLCGTARQSSVFSIAASPERMGLSVEASNCHVTDTRAVIYEVNKVEGIAGVAISNKASMRSSFQWLE